MDLVSEYNKIGLNWRQKLNLGDDVLRNIQERITEKTGNESLIFPVDENIFRAFKGVDYDSVSVVIVGQDPYHQKPELDGVETPQAMGLSFSVPNGVKVPPSLKNIYKEIGACLPSFTAPNHGDLSMWSSRVFLLNSALTVEYDKPASHSKCGWEKVTKRAIESLVERERPVVFLAWGKHAHKLCEIAEGTHHLVLKTSHPSPLGATKSGSDFESFLGSQCFHKANVFLVEHGVEPIDWTLI